MARLKELVPTEPTQQPRLLQIKVPAEVPDGRLSALPGSVVKVYTGNTTRLHKVHHVDMQQRVIFVYPTWLPLYL